MYTEELVEMYPELSRVEREEAVMREHGAVLLIGIGAPLVSADGTPSPPHENRAVDYDDWLTPNGHTTAGGRCCRGLNADILVWNDVTCRRHELSSMGVRVDAKELRAQAKMCGAAAALDNPYAKSILHGDVPSSIGGGVGISRTLMYLLRVAHLGEIQVAPWPESLLRKCEAHNIHVLT